MSTPAVTVLVPARNAERWIKESLSSIVGQSYPDIEILLVDDGSTDRTVPWAREVAGPNLRVLRGTESGVADALAMGLRETSTEIVLRHDADDLAEPNRIRSQVDYLLRHPDCVLVGSDATVVDSKGTPTGRISQPSGHAAIALRLCVMSAFVHPSVAFRRSAVLEVGNYSSPDARPYPEDFDLWSRLIQVGAVANIPEPLVNYRVSSTSLTGMHWPAVARSAGAIAADNLSARLGMREPPVEMKELMTLFHLRNRRITLREAAVLEKWLISARMSLGMTPAPSGFTWDIYARPLAWLRPSPRA